MSEDFTSLKAVARYLAACLAGAFLLIRLSASPESDQRSKEGPASFVRPQPDASTAVVNTAQVKASVQHDTLAAPNPFDKHEYIVQPGTVAEDDAPASVKEAEQRHTR